MKKKLLLILSVSLFLISCNDSAPTGVENHEPINGQNVMITSGGKQRSYILYKPSTAKPNAPLVFILHGDSLTNSVYYKKGFNSIADKYGFWVCYPQSSNKCWNFKVHKNEDVVYLTELAKNLQTKYSLNPLRTFAAGYSDGGSMCYLLALDASATFKSIAVVAGSITDSVWKTKPSVPKMSILHIHGDLDTKVPFAGGGLENYISVWTMCNDFSDTFNSDCYESLYTNTKTQVINVSSSSNRYYFKLYRTFEQRHVFPGDSIAVANKTDVSGIDAFSLIGIHFDKIK